jgi:lactate dehydrogenase-like 2-hydroxyacid dehydrogenase
MSTSVHPSPTINESTVSSLVSTGCLYVSTFGAGYNHVSIPYLASHGVTYANNPVSPGVRTADSTASMILSALRGSWGHDAEVRRGGWVRPGREWVARDARRCTLGVVGMGRIGKMGE